MSAVRRSGLSMLGALLALTAMLGLIGLSGWHGAYIHEEEPVHAVSVGHDHGSSKQADYDGRIHVLAHATGHWIAFAGAVPAPRTLPNVVRAWTADDYRLRGGIEPSELLRPPRS